MTGPGPRAAEPSALDTGRLRPLRVCEAVPARCDAPRILLLYGSLREGSYSRRVVQEAAAILERLGAEARIFDPAGLPLPGGAGAEHPRVRALRDAVGWCEGMVWCSPERHGAMTAVMKAQIDWIPLAAGGIRPTQGKTLAVMQVNGGSQSFNTVNQLRILGRWMRLLTIPNQASVPEVHRAFGPDGRMRPSPRYDRIVDVMEELAKLTLLTRDRREHLSDRYSERAAEAGAPAEARSCCEDRPPDRDSALCC